MAGFVIGRRDGSWFLRAQGCCGAGAHEQEYSRAHALQVLAGGGRLTEWDSSGFQLVDRKGRSHHYPRRWRPSMDPVESTI
jgi:hypothetical protein